MKRLSLIALMLAATLACEDTVSSAADADTEREVPVTTPEVPSDDAPGPPTPTPMPGVQIGSEGIVLTGCTTRALAADEVPAGFTLEAAALSDSWAGTQIGDLDAGGGLVAATLELVPTSWAVVEGVGCPERVVVGLTADLVALPDLDAGLVGFALVGPDLSTEFSVWTSSWEGSAVSVLDPADFDHFSLGLDGTIDDNEVGAEVLFEGCTTACTTDAYALLTTAI